MLSPARVSSSQARLPRTALAAGSCASSGGVALSLFGQAELGRALVVGGVILLLVGLHRLGRCGSDGSAAS